MNGALLEVCGASKAFEDHRAVANVSFTANAGEIIALIGPAGAGKTALINLICGLLVPDHGAIRLAGRDVTGLPAHALARAGIARSFGLARTSGEMTALETVMAGVIVREGVAWHAGAEQEAAELLRRVGLAGHERGAASDLPLGGQRRIELARALALKPRLLLLDEWLAGLSASELPGAIALIRSLATGETAIIMAGRTLSALGSLCLRALVMNEGRLIADGPTAEIMADRDIARLCRGA
jgi:branched-chain amino acid transport system ATP-binding protein